MVRIGNKIMLFLVALAGHGQWSSMAFCSLSSPAHHSLAQGPRINEIRLFCASDPEPSSSRMSPLCWTSRRGMMKYSLSAAIAPFLLQVSGASALDKVATEDINWDNSWMANPGKSFQKAQMLLAKEAEAAAAKVTQAHLDEYRTKGVTVVKNVVSQRWIEALRDGCEIAQDEMGPMGEYLQKAEDPGIFFTDLELARRLPLFSAFSMYGPAAAVAGTVMGSSSVRYLYDQLFIKEKGVSTRTPWHQDGGYWRVKGQQIASVFVPLDSVPAHEGLEFVRGSQEWRLHNPQHFADGTQYIGTSLPQMPDINELQRQERVRLDTFALKPGDVLVFSARTVHGGPGNWGRALSTRWTGDDGRYWDRPGEGAVPTGEVELNDGDLLSRNDLAFPEAWKST